MVQTTCKRNSAGQYLCNRVAKEYDTDHVQKQVNVIQDRSFYNQPAVCNSHYGTVSFFAYPRVFIQVWSTTINSRAAPLRLGLECGRIVGVHSSALLHSIYHLDHGETFLSYDHHFWTSKNS